MATDTWCLDPGGNFHEHQEHSVPIVLLALYSSRLINHYAAYLLLHIQQHIYPSMSSHWLKTYYKCLLLPSLFHGGFHYWLDYMIKFVTINSIVLAKKFYCLII